VTGTCPKTLLSRQLYEESDLIGVYCVLVGQFIARHDVKIWLFEQVYLQQLQDLTHALLQSRLEFDGMDLTRFCGHFICIEWGYEMAKMQRMYTPEFQQQVVGLVQAGPRECGPGKEVWLHWLVDTALALHKVA
jgi:hypothetical protein